MSEQPDNSRAHKARPARFRFTLWDDPAADSTPLEMPARQNTRPVGIVFAVFFAIFAAVMWMMIAKLLALKTPAPALVLLILLKIVVDLRAHRRERATKTGKPPANSGNGGK